MQAAGPLYSCGSGLQAQAGRVPCYPGRPAACWHRASREPLHCWSIRGCPRYSWLACLQRTSTSSSDTVMYPQPSQGSKACSAGSACRSRPPCSACSHASSPHSATVHRAANRQRDTCRAPTDTTTCWASQQATLAASIRAQVPMMAANAPSTPALMQAPPSARASRAS